MTGFWQRLFTIIFLLFLTVVFVANFIKLFLWGGLSFNEYALILLSCTSMGLCLTNFYTLSTLMTTIIYLLKVASYLFFFSVADTVIASQYNFLSTSHHTLLSQIVGSFFWVTLCALLTQGIWRISLPFMPKKYTQRLSFIITNIVNLLFYIITILIICNKEFNIDLVTLLAASGILTTLLTLTIGFSAKSILSDIISGVALSISPSFVIGDLVLVDTILGQSSTLGYVDNISWLTTTLKDRLGETVTIPNSKIIQTRLTNYSHTHGQKKIFIVTKSITLKMPHDHKSVISLLKDTLTGLIENKNPFAAVFLTEIAHEGAKYDISFETPSDRTAEKTTSTLVEISNALSQAGYEIA